MTSAEYRHFLLHGAVVPPERPIELRAGPFSLHFQSGDLRYLRIGDREVIRRIYAAVRDRNWGTVPGQISDLRVKSADSGFQITYTATHHQNEIHFVWRADLEGRPDGTIRFSFDGEAMSTFPRNRIGFCVLHPIRECAGNRCRARYVHGAEAELSFPRIIAPEQPVQGLRDLAGLSHEVSPGLWADVAFDGDVFEAEDQRNWIDASFKTYCTPLSLPFPVEIRRGTRIHQSVTVTLRPTGVSASLPIPGAIDDSSRTQLTPAVLSARIPASLVRIHRSAESCGRIPDIGLGSASHGHPLTDSEIRRIFRLHLAHLRVDLRLSDAAWRQKLRMAARDAMELGAGLELALLRASDGTSDLEAVASELARLKADPVRALILRDGGSSTTSADLVAARTAFKDSGFVIGAGTDADLYQLNLERPPGDADFIHWSMNPQVHAFDNTSIAETPEAAAEQITSVKAYFPGLPLVVSPVSLRPRFNAVATGPEDVAAAHELPPEVDPRQLSLFGAAWTLAMLKALSEAGADSVTFYETTGCRGVMESEEGSSLPTLFPSVAGTVFPLYHPLADLGELAGGNVLRTESSQPLAVASLHLVRGAHERLILANLSPVPQSVDLGKLPEHAVFRQLTIDTADLALNNPEVFRASWQPVCPGPIPLPAHALVTLDLRR